jgi:hypothetical protein
MDDDTLSSGDLAERRGYTSRHGQGGEPSAEPDVLLDVPQLRVEEIVLDVEDLRAHVSVQADVLSLLRLSVGADVQLGGVHLEIRGVEAQALLKVRLDKVAEIINRVLATIDRNPEIIEQIVAPLGAAASELEGTVGRSVDDVVDALESEAPELEDFVTEVTGETGESGALAEEEVADEAPEYEAEPGRVTEKAPRSVRRSRRERNSEEAPP